MPMPTPSPTLAPILRPLLVDATAGLALVLCDKIAVVVVTMAEESEMLEAGMVDGFEKAECADDEDDDEDEDEDEVEEVGKSVEEVDVRVAIL